MTLFDGKIALVTGATKGIGLAVAADLADAGAHVLATYGHDDEQAKKALATLEERGASAETVRCDVTKPAEVDALFKHVRERHGRLDALVSNAGITADGYAIMMGDDKWQRVLDANLSGAFACCRAAGRIMARQRSGAIVAVASTSAFNAPAGQVNYAASKAGLLATVRVLAKELATHGVRVNAVVPGFVETGMTRAMPANRLEEYVAHVPLGRIGQPDEVAPAVRFLLSEQAAYITGASVVIDGGLTC